MPPICCIFMWKQFSFINRKRINGLRIGELMGTNALGRRSAVTDARARPCCYVYHVMAVWR